MTIWLRAARERVAEALKNCGKSGRSRDECDSEAKGLLGRYGKGEDDYRRVKEKGVKDRVGDAYEECMRGKVQAALPGISLKTPKEAVTFGRRRLKTGVSRKDLAALAEQCAAVRKLLDRSSRASRELGGEGLAGLALALRWRCGLRGTRPEFGRDP